MRPEISANVRSTWSRKARLGFNEECLGIQGGGPRDTTMREWAKRLFEVIIWNEGEAKWSG